MRSVHVLRTRIVKQHYAMPRSRVRSKYTADALYVFISTHVRACRRENMIIFLFSQSHDIYLYWVQRIPPGRYARYASLSLVVRNTPIRRDRHTRVFNTTMHALLTRH